MDSYNESIVYLLMNLSSTYMELRHYKEVIECIDECLSIVRDKVPDLYFRRSQARAYNKLSTDEDYNLARLDIEKAISLKKKGIYLEHLEKLQKIQYESKKTTIELMESMFIIT